jgi:hypothetical protein
MGPGGPRHLLRFSHLIGPMPEWFIYDVAEHGEFFETRFGVVVEQILMSEPGDYDDLPWHFSDDATEILAQN